MVYVFVELVLLQLSVGTTIYVLINNFQLVVTKLLPQLQHHAQLQINVPTLSVTRMPSHLKVLEKEFVLSLLLIVHLLQMDVPNTIVLNPLDNVQLLIPVDVLLSLVNGEIGHNGLNVQLLVELEHNLNQEQEIKPLPMGHLIVLDHQPTHNLVLDLAVQLLVPFPNGHNGQLALNVTPEQKQEPEPLFLNQLAEELHVLMPLDLPIPLIALLVLTLTAVDPTQPTANVTVLLD